MWSRISGFRGINTGVEEFKINCDIKEALLLLCTHIFTIMVTSSKFLNSNLERGLRGRQGGVVGFGDWGVTLRARIAAQTGSRPEVV